MDEISINAKFAALVDQRNNALNQCVNLSGELAVALEKIKVLESQVTKEVEQDA